MANALLRNVTVQDYAGNNRSVEMTDFIQDQQDVIGILQAQVCQEVKLGGAVATTTTLRHAVSPTPENPFGVASILATVTATGAAAAKLLLAIGVDYTVSGNTITWLTDQSANSVVISYHPNLNAQISDYKAVFPAR
jgi:hypothetical protein